MNCKYCGNPLMENDKGFNASKSDERYGVCDACWERLQHKVTEEYSSKTTLLGIIGILLLLCGIGTGIYFFIQSQTLTGLIYIAISIVIFAFIKGFSDIIDLLTEINEKMK